MSCGAQAAPAGSAPARRVNCSNTTSGISMRSELIRRWRSCRERSKGMRLRRRRRPGGPIAPLARKPRRCRETSRSGPSKSGRITTMRKPNPARSAASAANLPSCRASGRQCRGRSLCGRPMQRRRPRGPPPDRASARRRDRMRRLKAMAPEPLRQLRLGVDDRDVPISQITGSSALGKPKRSDWCRSVLRSRHGERPRATCCDATMLTRPRALRSPK